MLCGTGWSQPRLKVERKIKPRQGVSRRYVKRGSSELKGRLDRKCISGRSHWLKGAMASASESKNTVSLGEEMAGGAASQEKQKLGEQWGRLLEDQLTTHAAREVVSSLREK